MDISRIVREHEAEMLRLRRGFHRIPETGYEEYKTSRMIRDHLEALGLETEIYTETGVVAVLDGGSDGPSILLRSDMDALDVEEQTNLEYRSAHAGKMHACGHDAHMAALLTAATILTENKSELKGRVVFVFQPNEERAGALNMILEGLLEKHPVKACAAMHVWPQLKTGQIGIADGAVMAGMDHFRIRIDGRGGHTGSPHLAKDPVLCAASVIQSLQAIQTREIDIQKPTLIMIGKLESGSASNIIPDHAELSGTCRYLYRLTPEEDLQGRIERHVVKICEAHDMKGTVTWEEGHPAVFNDPETASAARAMAADIVGPEGIVELRSTAGEDFSEFTHRVPGVFCHIGTGNETKETRYSLHHPKFDIDEEALKIMTELHIRLALSLTGSLDPEGRV